MDELIIRAHQAYILAVAGHHLGDPDGELLEPPRMTNGDPFDAPSDMPPPPPMPDEMAKAVAFWLWDCGRYIVDTTIEGDQPCPTSTSSATPTAAA